MNRRRIWIEIAAISMMLLVTVEAILRPGDFESLDMNHPRSADEQGCRALWRALLQMHIDARMWARPPADLAGRGNVLFLFRTSDASVTARSKHDAASATALASEDPDYIRKWVEAGNCIVVAAGEDLSEQSLLKNTFKLGELAASAPSPQSRKSRVRAVDPKDAFLKNLPDGAKIWYDGNAGPFGAEIPYGKGGILAVATLELYENDKVRPDFEPAAEFLVKICERLRHFTKAKPGAPSDDGRVLLDTYYFGERNVESGWARAFSGSALPATLHVIAAVLIYLCSIAFRFGAVREPSRRIESGNVVAARGMGELYRRGGHPDLAARAIAASFAQRAREAVGLPPTVAMAALAARVADVTKRDPREIESLLSPDSPFVGRSLATYARAVREVEDQLETGELPRNG
ncbi:MAG: DUF4350 domain-containing protein [Planctomycetes bacterium]|nr:DUF4350 domain-containing protein [Planctomycetota bacterium]